MLRPGNQARVGRDAGGGLGFVSERVKFPPWLHAAFPCSVKPH